MGQSRYTLELRKLIDNPRFKVFDFEYNFYNEEFKPIFEKRFLDHYRYHDIGCETIDRWKHMLKTRLNDLYPIFKLRYEAIEKNKNTNWFANKDLTITDVRTLRGKNTSVMDSTNNIETNSKDLTDSTVDVKESALNNLNARIDTDRYATGKNKTNSKVTNTNNVNDKSISKSTGEGTNEIEEVNKHHEIGNIGVTSSATLLDEYFKLMKKFDLDGQIIEECWDLFYLL